MTGFALLSVGSASMEAQVWTINVCSNIPSTTQSNLYGPMYSVATANATNRLTSIYPASQLSGIAAQTLTSIYFHTGAGHASGMLGTPNLKVYLKEVSNLDWGSGALDWATASTGATLVFDGNPAPLIGTGGGWKQIPLTTNFTYSGAQNLAVFLEYKNPTASNAITWSYEYTSPCVSGSTTGTETKYSNNTTGNLPASLASTNSRRPYIGFDYNVTCPAPTIPAVTNITTNSATATWVAGGSETNWDYAVLPSNAGLPTTWTNTNTPTATLSLNPQTEYIVYVRANCGGSNGESVWKASSAFKTLCAPIASMFENFDSYSTGSIVPDCWNRIITTNGSQTITSTTPASGTRNIYQNSSTTQNPTVVVLPEFSNVNAGTHWLRFKARVSSATGTLNVGYVTDPTNASTFTLIQALTITNTAYDSTSEYTVIIPSTVPANARLAIRNTPDAKSYYWDDVYWEATPSCFAPSSLAVSGITQNNALLSWAAPATAPANGYEVYFSSSSTPPTSSTLPSLTGITTLSANIGSLQPSTNYYAWVRSVCNSSDKSNWTSVLNFKTLCGSITGAYFEDFEGYPGVTNGSAGGVLPNCWTNLGTADGGHISNSTTISGNNTLYLWTSGSRIAFVALPAMSTLQSGDYRLKFDAKASVTAGGILEIGYLDTANAFVALTTFSVNAINTTFPFSFDIPVLPAGVTQLAIKNTGTPANSLSIDNVSYELKTLSTSENVVKNNIKVYPNPFTDIVNIDRPELINTIKIIDLSGKLIRNNMKAESVLRLNDLSAGLYILVLEMKDGSRQSIKVIKK